MRDVFGPQARSAQKAFDVQAQRAGLSARDRAFSTELAYGTIEQRRLLDWYLLPYLGARSKQLPSAIADVLRLGVYQLLMMDGVDVHAAVHETVGLALRHGHRGTAGLVNAVLRRLASDDPSPPQRANFEDELDYYGLTHSLPNWIVAQFQATFPAGFEATLRGINSAPQRALCVNTLRGSVDAALMLLAAGGVRAKRSLRVPEIVVVTDGVVRDDPSGRWSLQSESAALPVAILAPKAGETVLDLCAGRGNKTLQIAARMQDRGALYAVELDARTSHALMERLERSEVGCAAVLTGDVRSVELPAADAVLLDAPCSAIGIIGRHPEARWRKSPDDGARLGVVQSQLLEAAALPVKPGGRLVYSVCSTDPREGTLVVEAFLEEQREFARDGDDVLIPPGIEGRDGFYIAALRRAE